jgi:hypothetical protein
MAKLMYGSVPREMTYYTQQQKGDLNLISSYVGAQKLLYVIFT